MGMYQLFTGLFSLSALYVCSGSSCSDPLSCLLASIDIVIPPIAFNVTNSSVLYITNLECSGVALDAINSSYIPPTTLGVGIVGLSTYCSGLFSYTDGLSGSIVFPLNDASFDINVNIGTNANEYGVPDSASFSYCYSSLIVDISFTGGSTPKEKGKIAKLNNVLAPIVDALLPIALNQLLCVKLADYVATNVTQNLVNNVDPKLLSIIQTAPMTVPTFDFQTLNWQTSILGKMYQILGRDEVGRLEACAVEAYPAIADINLWIDFFLGFLTDDNGNIVIPLNETIHVQNSTLSIETLTISGLTTFSELVLFEPSQLSNETLLTQIALESFKLTLNSTLLGSPESQYVEHHQIVFGLTNITLGFDLVIALNEKVLNAYYLDQLNSKGCWLDALGYFNISSLLVDITLDQISFIEVSGGAAALEKDVAALIDNISLLVTEGFGPLTTNLIAG